ncbi:MAG TPA: hypothetical protein VEJ84_21485 [Acidimicrobiales bacterium]|nr:hypothetical protein [Acidimicrobiales bacterium]
MPATSGVQVATLVVAGLAVIATVTGYFITAHFSRRSEHAVWQRDTRMRLYGDCINTASQLILSISDHWTVVRRSEGRTSTARDSDVGSPPTLSDFDHDEFLSIADMMLKLAVQVDDIETFGSATVATAANDLRSALKEAAYGRAGRTWTEERAFLKAASDRLDDLRSTIRSSLHISDT